MRKKDLLSESKKSLMERAAGLRIRGRSKMGKADLAEAILQADKEGADSVSGSLRTTHKGARRTRRSSAKKRQGPVRERILVRRSWREQQAVVQHAKYEVKMARGPRPVRVAPELRELPTSYDEDRIVLLVRDPYWIHAYWDITRPTLLRARRTLGDEWHLAKSILRVHDVTGIEFDGHNSNSHFDIEIAGGASNWYINTQVPNRTYCVEIGLLTKSDDFVVLARSNKATTPRDAPSDVTDEEWMIPDWEFEKVYALSGGFTVGAGSLELKEMMEKALGGEVGSAAPGSFAVSSPVGKVRARGFWFRLGTELIVYGATEPDAKVTLQGRPIKLRPDGTFTVRYDLPDGKQVIPAVAESVDGVDKITITPVVSKKTEK